MAFLEWTERYSTTVPKMDEQHQQLFQLLNSLYESIDSCQTLEEERHLTGVLLSKLTEYVSVHFSAEELLLEQINYPGLEDHRSEHARLSDEIKALSDSFAEGEVALSFDTFILLRDWIANHILITDAKYIPYTASAKLNSTALSRES